MMITVFNLNVIPKFLSQPIHNAPFTVKIYISKMISFFLEMHHISLTTGLLEHAGELAALPRSPRGM